MNLLSHYYLDKEHSSVYFKLGVLLPDLVPRFNQRMRRDVFAARYTQPEHQELFDGIQKHYAVDAVFHQSEEFNSFCNLISRELKPDLFPSFQHRKYFMAHVFVEMLIDRVLVKHSPYLCVQMKDDLEKTETGVLKSYFSLIEKPVIHTEFLYNFNRFLSGKPLLFYSDNEMFVKALMRVYQRINPRPASPREAEHLIRLAEAIENNHRASLSGIFETVNERLAVYA